MIDIHTHILPAVDDGASCFEESEQMLRMAAEDGTTSVVATPHADLRYSYDPEQCAELIENLRTRCPGAPQIHTGCELHLTPENLQKVARRPQQFTLNGRDCVLLELPDTAAPEVVRPALDLLSSFGLRVVIAHPERNLAIQRRPDFADELVDAGCYLQLTAQSIGGAFGAGAQNASMQMLHRRIAHFVATDAHGSTMRRPLLSGVFRKVADRFGEAAAELLFIENPKAALSGTPIRQLPSPGNWFTSLFSRRTPGLGQQTGRNLP